MPKMHRTQVLLEETQYREVRRLAEAEGRSVGEVIRELLDRGLRSLGDARSRRLGVLDELARLRAQQALAEADLAVAVRAELERRTPV